MNQENPVKRTPRLAKNQKEALQKVKQLKEVREETDDVKWEPGTESQMWCAKVRTSSQRFCWDVHAGWEGRHT